MWASSRMRFAWFCIYCSDHISDFFLILPTPEQVVSSELSDVCSDVRRLWVFTLVDSGECTRGPACHHSRRRKQRQFRYNQEDEIRAKHATRHNRFRMDTQSLVSPKATAHQLSLMLLLPASWPLFHPCGGKHGTHQTLVQQILCNRVCLNLWFNNF